MTEWLIRVVGKQRKDINIDQAVQAVIALGHQLAGEARAITRETQPRPEDDREAEPKRDGAS